MHPALTPLEPRRLFSAGPSATLIDGLLKVTGTEGKDWISITYMRDTLDDSPVHLQVDFLSGDNPMRFTFPRPRQIRTLEIDVMGDDDRVFVTEQNAWGYYDTPPDPLPPAFPILRIPMRVFGGAGDDTLLGAGGPDRLIGGAGDDSISGGGGNDTLYGDAGQDTLKGWRGDDALIGGGDSDALYGERGNDTLDGGTARDLIRGGDGADTLSEDFFHDEQYLVVTGFFNHIHWNSNHDGTRIEVGSRPRNWVRAQVIGTPLSALADQLAGQIVTARGVVRTIDDDFQGRIRFMFPDSLEPA